MMFHGTSLINFNILLNYCLMRKDGKGKLFPFLYHATLGIQLILQVFFIYLYSFPDLKFFFSSNKNMVFKVERIKVERIKKE